MGLGGLSNVLPLTSRDFPVYFLAVEETVASPSFQAVFTTELSWGLCGGLHQPRLRLMSSRTGEEICGCLTREREQERSQSRGNKGLLS